MRKAKALILWLLSINLMCAMFFSAMDITARAAGNDTQQVGIAAVIGLSADADAGKELAKATEAAGQVQQSQSSSSSDTSQASDSASEEESSDLVMANVSMAANVRNTPDEDATKAGVLYKDCGGRILERKDGWTRIQSGDLVGWVKDDYLYFDEDAQKLAKEVGNSVIRVKTDALRVRKEPNGDADTYGILAEGNQLDIVKDLGDGWISVAYDDETGYVQADYVDTDFSIDAGETIAAIREREKEAAEKKAKLTTNRGAVVANADQTRLLAALIQCEAGNQPYDGQVAVGAVVMNRMRSGAYPNSMEGVIYASGQFTPALNGKVARVYEGNISSACMSAAQAALGGATTVGDATHFKRSGNHDGIIIGNHVFW